MATFTITTGEFENTPPFQIGETIIILDDSTSEYTFTIDDFTIDSNPPYADAEGDPLSKIKILSILDPAVGFLELNGVAVIVGQEIDATDIVGGLLKFRPDGDNYQTIFVYDVSDTGSNQFGNLEGVINLNIPEVINLPPELGDNTLTLDYGESEVFTPGMFTTDTSPPYTDPENDAPAYLRFVTLPTSGVIKLNGIDVETYQEISFADIAAGQLAFYPDLNITTQTTLTFNFEIRDTGSGQWGV